MSRRPHPYFSRINRLDQASKPEPGSRRKSAPVVAVHDETGILWDALRSPEGPEAESA